MRILLIEIASTGTLAGLTPDYAALLQSHDGINGVLVTAPAFDDGYDYHSRYFWPWSGTDEDPVTGGTQMFLARYWSSRLGKTSLRAFQSSRRSGFMALLLQGDTLLISGQAQVIFRGELVVAVA